jgi:hypothetical protein
LCWLGFRSSQPSGGRAGGGFFNGRLDKALALDGHNQRSLIEAAAEFGFSLIFASPAPLTTVSYCAPIRQRQGSNYISDRSKQTLEPQEAP